VGVEVGDVLHHRLFPGGLHVVRQVGEGGFAKVYAVGSRPGSEEQALKVMHDELRTDANAVSRFLREAEVAAKVRSPRVPVVVGHGTLSDGPHFILTELLRGETLRELLKRGGRISPRRVAEIGAQVCEGLAVAHGEGVLHRDLAPDNVFLVASTGGDVVKLLDFGIATFVSGSTDRFGALTRTNAVIGTPYYMSPEQVHAKELDARSDLCSLGVVLYEAITGVRPFEGENLGLLLSAIHTGQHRPIEELAPEAPGALIAAIEKAMAREREDRFGSAKEMATALRAAATAPLEPRPSRVAAAAVALALAPEESSEPSVSRARRVRREPVSEGSGSVDASASDGVRSVPGVEAGMRSGSGVEERASSGPGAEVSEVREGRASFASGGSHANEPATSMDPAHVRAFVVLGIGVVVAIAGTVAVILHFAG